MIWCLHCLFVIYYVYAWSGTRFSPWTRYYAAEAAIAQCVRTGGRSCKATSTCYVRVPYQPHVAISSPEIAWVDCKQLCWRAECASQTWPDTTLEYSDTQSNSADMPLLWQEGKRYPPLPDSWVRVRPVLRGYARPLLPIQYGTPSISGNKCQSMYIYMVYVMYTTCICL